MSNNHKVIEQGSQSQLATRAK